MKSAFTSFFSVNPVSITILVTAAVVALFQIGFPILVLIELKTYDLRFRSRGQLQPTPVVTLALIDEKSLDAEGRWPWPRTKLARLVQLLSQHGAKVIGFDIGFFEPSDRSHAESVGAVGNAPQSRTIPTAEPAGRPSPSPADADMAFADAIRNSSAAVILGYFFHMEESDLNFHFDQDRKKEQLERIGNSKYPIIIYKQKDMAADPFVHAFAPESNIGILADAADASGFYSLRSEQDGVVRWAPLIIKCEEDLYPPLSLLCAWHYLDRPRLLVKVAHYGIEGVQMGDRFIPTDENGGMLINFLGPPKTFPHLSITDILSGRIAAEAVRDRIVLVGATAMGTHDLRSTPVSPLFSGVETHATVIDNILSRSFITKPKWSRIYDLLAIVLLGLITGTALPRLSAAKGLLLAVGLFLSHYLAARWLFVHQRVWLNMVFPLLALSLNYTALTAYRYVAEERERKRIKGAFRQYVAPLVIEELLDAPEKLKLGGEEKTLTVLFTDIEGFTTYSERYSPSEMIDILSGYYDRMTEQIFRYRGTLKEYVGDEIMAFFGAPLEHPDHAQRACAAALGMREQLCRLNEEWSKVGWPRLKARTGINTGPMLVGNLGSRYRFAYGVLGDQVNLGSRLEGLNKIYGTDVLVGENTARRVQSDFLLRKIDVVRVAGRTQSVAVFELVAKSGGGLSGDRQQMLLDYAAGFDAYRNRRWGEALGFFRKCRRLCPDDGPSRIMAERCRTYREAPPPEEWDGAYDPGVK
ncbi:MAG: CHASE2 domain-containing protein [Desulfobacterales bacterium]